MWGITGFTEGLFDS